MVVSGEQEIFVTIYLAQKFLTDVQMKKSKCQPPGFLLTPAARI